MRYVFVIPRYGAVRGYYAPPLGIGSLIAALRADGRDVACINMNEIDGSAEDCLRGISAKHDVVLTGGLSIHFGQVEEIVKVAKRVGCVTVVGGGLLSAEPAFVYGLLRPTYGVIGEGEKTIQELAAGLDIEVASMRDMYLRRVAGLIFDRDGEVTFSGEREPIENLDKLDCVDYEAIGMPQLLGRQSVLDEPYFQATDTPRMVPVVTSRSCAYRCSFCFSPTGNKYRRRGMDHVFSEVDHIIDRYHPNVFMFLDELLAANKTRLFEFCERVGRYAVSWICQLHVKSVTDEALRAMRDAGCVCISYGIESAVDEVLEGMHKHSTRTDIETALDLTYKNNIGIQGNLIFGTASETEQTAQQSLDWWRANARYLLNITPVYPYPGSELYRDAVANGKITNREQYLRDRCPPVNVSKMSNEAHAALLDEIVSLQHTQSQFVNGDVSVVAGGAYNGREVVTVGYACAHCGQRNERRNIPARDGMGRKTLRYACRHCNQRSDFPKEITA